MTRPLSRSTARRPRLLLLLTLLAVAAFDCESAVCCADCLAQTDPNNKVLTYDAVIHDQCSAVKGICCYGCQFGHGNPTYDAGVTFNDKGDAETTAGQVVKVSMSSVSRITFDFLATNQPKSSFVGNRSTEAARVDGSFQLCARGAGVIAFRGWGADSCTQVTQEYKIQVKAGDGTKTCDAGVVKPADPSATSTPDACAKEQPACEAADWRGKRRGQLQLDARRRQVAR
ncbi:hypothetical protein PINS_up021441 [Pythium insidiosum]|nr:hypothetical protein PINS_up021441 [Pythium insidiosum]